jgi:SPP1 family predicted phage head-tail adaptor
MTGAGALRFKVTIQEATEVRDTFGEPIQTWGTYRTVWASIDPLTGGERFHAQQVDPSVDYRIRFRYVPGVTAKMRILYGSRVFEIQSVIDAGERTRWLECLCREHPQ